MSDEANDDDAPPDPADDGAGFRVLALRETHRITTRDGRKIVVEHVTPGPGVDPATADALLAPVETEDDFARYRRELAACVTDAAGDPAVFRQLSDAFLRRHGHSPLPDASHGPHHTEDC